MAIANGEFLLGGLRPLHTGNKEAAWLLPLPLHLYLLVGAGTCA